MAVPFRCDDGDHDVLLETGRDISFPFFDRGDSQTFEYIIKYNQDKDAFRKAALMSRMAFPLGDGFLVEQGNPTDAGFGLYEFTRTYSAIPATRREGMTANLSISVPITFDIVSTIDFITGAYMLFEYFPSKPQPLYKPIAYIFGLIPDVIICQDSEIDIYKGGIYVRKTIVADKSALINRFTTPL